ncbi:MAG TPA: hypothetical protein PLC07_06150 [Bacillota bacterium]|nr:hypothetical protein [Bacillota bacterium]HPT86979.1 hypothetical protein [Bacillota bacterium]
MWHLSNIPKIAHFYWGNDTISFLRYLTIYSFKKYNPDWEIRLYYPKVKYRGSKTWHTGEHASRYNGPNYMNHLLNLGVNRIEYDFSVHGLANEIPESFKADFLRWYLLGTVGGLWSDMDIVYFRPVDHLYLNQEANSALTTIVCLHEASPENYHSIGFLMSSPNNPYYKFITSQTYGMLNLTDYQSIGSRIPNLYFPKFSMIADRFPGLTVANLAPDVVYPIDFTMVPYIFHTPYMHYLTERSIGLHWFAGHPEALHFENLINDDSHVGYNSIIAQLVRKAIGWG